MWVTLAYEYQGQAPDSTIELPDEEGQRLINDGRARPADGSPASPQQTREKSGVTSTTVAPVVGDADVVVTSSEENH